MAPKVNAAKAPTPPPSGSTALQDPLLQGTYVHNDADDFQSPSHDLDDFDERLISGQPAHSPAAGGQKKVAAGSGAKAVALQKQIKTGGESGPRRPPMRSSFDHHTAPAATGSDRGDHRRPSITEDEADARAQRQQDIDDVRHLDARFGASTVSDDSD